MMPAQGNKSVATIKLEGNYHWAIVAEMCIALQEKGFTVYFNWSNGNFMIEMKEDKTVPDTAYIKSNVERLVRMANDICDAVGKKDESKPEPLKRGRPLKALGGIKK